MNSASRSAALFAVILVLGIASCRSYRREAVTPWLREVHWENETIIAESGRGRGTYLEVTDERGNVVRVEGWGCSAVDFGRAALCQDPEQGVRGRAFVLRRSGERRVIECPYAPASGDEMTSGMIQKLGERELACVQRRYEPSYLEITTRMDLDGRVLERRESTIPPGR
jgi:hypothetical protein